MPSTIEAAPARPVIKHSRDGLSFRCYFPGRPEAEAVTGRHVRTELETGRDIWEVQGEEYDSLGGAHGEAQLAAIKAAKAAR